LILLKQTGGAAFHSLDIARRTFNVSTGEFIVKKLANLVGSIGKKLDKPHPKIADLITFKVRLYRSLQVDEYAPVESSDCEYAGFYVVSPAQDHLFPPPPLSFSFYRHARVPRY